MPCEIFKQLRRAGNQCRSPLLERCYEHSSNINLIDFSSNCVGALSMRPIRIFGFIIIGAVSLLPLGVLPIWRHQAHCWICGA
ncbi:hypothetical protein C6558_23245 [Ensifer sp. NM-2]|nr:hypothetical protein C6558_23245 [Ensifer sp. NM-2]